MAQDNKSNHSNDDKSMNQEQQDVDPVLDKAIGAQLKKLYKGVEDEAVPDRFAELLKQLESQESQED